MGTQHFWANHGTPISAIMLPNSRAYNGFPHVLGAWQSESKPETIGLVGLMFPLKTARFFVFMACKRKDCDNERRILEFCSRFSSAQSSDTGPNV